MTEDFGINQLQDSSFFTRRYILSACMNWNDCSFIRSDGSKISNWKKEKKSKIRMEPQTWKIEISNVSGGKGGKDDADSKTDIASVTLEEVKDTDKPFQFISIKYAKGDVLCVTGNADFVNLFYCGLMYHLEKVDEIENNQFVVSKKQEFDAMLESVKNFLSEPLCKAAH